MGGRGRRCESPFKREGVGRGAARAKRHNKDGMPRSKQFPDPQQDVQGQLGHHVRHLP